MRSRSTSRHRRDQSVALGRRERFEQLGGERVAAAVEQRPLLAAEGGQAGGADPAVAGTRADGDQAGGLERAQQPAEVAGVEIEPGAERADVAATFTDLPQQARLAERALACEVVVVERADPLGHGPVEAPDAGDHRLVDHSSDFSQRYPRRARRSAGRGVGRGSQREKCRGA